MARTMRRLCSSVAADAPEPWLGRPTWGVPVVRPTVHTVRMDTGAGMTHRNDPAVVRRLLEHRGRWAVVGLSSNSRRVAYRIANYLQDLGMEIIPVHPRADTVHGAKGYSTLAEIPGSIDVVDVFVRSELAGAVVDQAIAAGAKAVWLQLGVIDEAAAARASAAGLDVVMNTCPAIEAPRLGLA
jgi:predicted CoA-binding protein